MKKIVIALWITLLSSCGYQYIGQERASSRALSVNVPLIAGDEQGTLSSELVYQLSTSGQFQCQGDGAAITLAVVCVSDEHDRIGFRYDRDNPSGRKEKNLLGVEDRRIIEVEISLIDTRSRAVLFGPKRVKAWVDYDYTDPGSPRDQVLGRNDPMMQFSLGQLDSAEGAFDGASRSLFRKLSQKIVLELMNCSDLWTK